MKPKYTLLLLCCCAFFYSKTGQAQNPNMPCASDFWREKALQDPIFLQKHEAFETEVLQVFEQKKQVNGQADNLRTVPVVVHIIHDGGPENISDAQVQQAIVWLNQALANQGNFDQGSGASAEIQLCLAQRTPDGQASNGITRNQSPLTEMQLESQDLQVKNLNRWKPKDYINIWIVRSICSANFGCGVYGYSNYPFAHGSNIDGVMMEAAYLTDISKITGLAHEIGHYFGLYHTFEGGCTNSNCLTQGDRICDTPPDQSTAGVPCGQPVNTCSTDTQSGPFATDQPDMSWNFMDYGIIACFHDFTPDQSTRMNAALDGARKSLLESRGCLPPCPSPVVASFTASSNTVAVGGTLTFTNTSQNAISTLWMIDGVTFSTQTNASYTFPAIGEYTITLQASPANSDLCAVEEIEFVVQVYCPVSASFTVSNTGPEENETIYLSNTSQNTTQNTWTINGQNQGVTLDSIAFDVPGVFEIQLIASNGICSDTSSTYVYTQEVCVNKTFEYEGKILPAQNSQDVFASTVLTDGRIVIAGTVSEVDTSVCLLTAFNPDGSIDWSKVFFKANHYLSDSKIRATLDGGFVLVVNSISITNQAFLAKFSSNGELEWIRSCPVADVSDLLVLPDGILVAEGALLIKFSFTGNLLWAKSNLFIRRMVAYPDGGFLTVSGNAPSAVVSRFDSNANEIWSKNIWSGTSISGNDLIATPEGNIFIVGKKETNLTSIFHGLLIKLNADGETQWSKTYRQAAVSTYNFEWITLSTNGNIIISGTAWANTPGPGPLDPYQILLKINQEGILIWSRHKPGIKQAVDFTQLPEGGSFLLGNYLDKFWLQKTDSQGYTLSCPEIPLQINAFEAFLMDSLLIHNIQDYTYTPSTGTDSLLDYQLLFDILCPPTCAQTFEICNNNIDDDGDDLFDCLDPDCNCTEDQCAPKQANIWYFGQKAGLDFSTEPPSMLSDGNTINFVGSAAQCDENGALLFYTDGVRVFNRFHEIMPNGTISTWGGAYYCLILPNPAKLGEYFLAYETNTNEVKILIVDMALDDGRGDVSGTFINLPEHIGLAGTKLCGSPDAWLLTHTKGQNSVFEALRFGSTVPILITISGVNEKMQLISQLKIAPNGDKVACTYFTDTNFDSTRLVVYDFNILGLGVVSNSRLLETLKMPNRFYGVEFSPDGRFLYATGELPGLAKLVQFDLEAGDLAAIKASRTVLATDQVTESIYPQLAPNGKIYLPNANFSTTLDVIHQPNRPGTQCQFQAKAQIAADATIGAWTGVGLCNILASNLQSTPRIAFPHDAPDTICSLNSPIEYHIPRVSCTSDSLDWRLENLDAQITLNNQSAVIQYLSPGAGRLIVAAYTPCGVSSDTLNILVVAPLNQTVDLGPDLVVCQNGVFTFNAGSGFARYLWSDGTADSTVTTLFPGTYWVKAWDLCGNLQTDSITVSIAPNSVLDLGPDLPQQCSGFSVNYQRPANFESWSWSPADFLSCTDCPNVTVSPNVSASWIVIGQTVNGCISIDTLSAIIRDTLIFSLDTSVCVGETLALFGVQLPADTTAEFFLPALGVGCDTLLTVNVLGVDNSATNLSVRICADAFYTYNGLQLPADTVVVFHFNSVLACDSVVTLTVNAFPALNLSLPQDTTIRIGASVLLESETSGTGNLDFAWSPSDGLSCVDCPDPLASPLDTITYTLAVTDANGCTAEETVTVRVNEECRVQFPNAFTPNGDGSNDVFRPILDPCVRTVRLWKIINRWGQPVFEQINLSPNDPTLGWDGLLNGKPHASDVLIWVAEVEYFDGRRESWNGEVTLVR